MNDLDKPREVEVPAQKETFEAQVLVMAKPYKKTVFPLYDPVYYNSPTQALRVIESERYRIELILSSYVGGKPTLIIHEEADEPK